MPHLPTEDEARGLEVEHAVLEYLKRHPDAADTLDGIVSWWLPQQRYEIARQRIEHVLRDLVASGKLRCEGLPGGVVIYSLNKPLAPSSH